jgi:dTMP kinase
LLYIAGGLTHAKDSKLSVYKDIQEGCAQAGFDAYLPHEDTGSRKDNLDPNRVFDANLAAINRCVGVIAEVGVGSHGVGIEIEYAARRGKPVLAIAPKGADVSRMVLGHPGIRGGVRWFASTRDVSGLVAKLIETELRGIGTVRARLVALEGPDFVGKGTVAGHLAESSSRLFGRDGVLVTDPPWKLQPWDSLSSVFRSDERLSGPAEALLFGAARVDNYERQIKPALDSGKMVFCDRYIDSWFAYQSVRLKSRGFDPDKSLEFLLTQQTMWESFRQIEPPGITVLLMADVSELKRRAEVRSTRDKYENWDFLGMVLDAYEELHSRFPYRIVRVETTGRDERDVLELVSEIVKEYVQPST